MNLQPFIFAHVLDVCRSSRVLVEEARVHRVPYVSDETTAALWLTCPTFQTPVWVLPDTFPQSVS